MEEKNIPKLILKAWLLILSLPGVFANASSVFKFYLSLKIQ